MATKNIDKVSQVKVEPKITPKPKSTKRVVKPTLITAKDVVTETSGKPAKVVEQIPELDCKCDAAACKCMLEPKCPAIKPESWFKRVVRWFKNLNYRKN